MIISQLLLHIYIYLLLFCRSLTPTDVNDVLDALEEDDSFLTDQLDEDDRTGVTYVNITVEPPSEEAGVMTDEDSDGSDNEGEGDFAKLPKRIDTKTIEVASDYDQYQLIKEGALQVHPQSQT